MDAPHDDNPDESTQYADLPPGEPRVFFSSTVLVGRFYGQSEADADLVFGLAQSFYGVPTLGISTPDDDHWRQTLDHGGVLVQLYEQPDVAWFAEVALLNNLPTIRYIPVHLESTDGTQMVRLQPVAAEKTEKALADRRTALLQHRP